MKKLVIGIIVGFTFATAGAVYADEGLQKVEAYLRPTLPITLDGKSVTLEASPIMYDGSTYLKLRDVAGLTGLQVNWNDATQTVELGKGVAPMAVTPTTNPDSRPGKRIDDANAVSKTTFNGLDAFEYNGNTYFPVFRYNEKNKDNIIKFDSESRSLITQQKTINVDTSGEEDIIFYLGETYLNVKYYP
jgi:hypothetical protein